MTVPALVIVLAVEAARVEIRAEGVEGPEDCSRLGQWIGGEPRRHALALQALALARPRIGDLEDDELLERLAAELTPAPDPYDEICPLGSFQRRSLRYVVDRLDPARCAEWFAWALRFEWDRDPGFAAALREVARREGLDGPGTANENEAA